MVNIGYSFPNPFQTILIQSGSNATVYTFSVPAGGTGFISAVGLHLPNTSCRYRWLVDGERVEESDIQYQIGKINQPTPFDPPILFRKKVEFIGYNDGTNNETFEVLCRGVYYVEQ